MTKTQSLDKANELISYLVNALDAAQRTDNLFYVKGVAEQAIARANRERVRNEHGYLVVR
jgi:hypothetical protein